MSQNQKSVNSTASIPGGTVYDIDGIVLSLENVVGAEILLATSNRELGFQKMEQVKQANFDARYLEGEVDKVLAQVEALSATMTPDLHALAIKNAYAKDDGKAGTHVRALFTQLRSSALTVVLKAHPEYLLRYNELDCATNELIGGIKQHANTLHAEAKKLLDESDKVYRDNGLSSLLRQAA